MRPLSSLFALPSSILLLLCISPSPVTPEQPWPYNLPKHMKYFPEDEVHVKRSLSIRDRLQREAPVGVRKMSTDEGEMFFFDNWIFEGDNKAKFEDESPISTKNRRRVDKCGLHSGDWEGHANSSVVLPASSPLRPHSQANLDSAQLRFARRDILMNRGFKCPDGTSDCSSIGQPNSCCSTSDTCISITDTGFGTVGCCPKGQNCAGQISCDTANGYTSCPNSPNGGCCLPGYTCLDVGCVVSGTSTAITIPQQTSTVIASTSSSTAVVVVPTTPSSSATYTCSVGWFSCPASLGGGCCQTGLQCASGAACTGESSRATSSSVTPSAPVRPTSINSNSGVTATSTSISNSLSLCPTGFYVCSAYYPSGCCRVGRDCHTTGSCIPTASASVVVSDGVTIVAPTGASFATTAAGQGGSCPSGWYSCAASLGGNCCLNGYSCGQQCTATASGQTQVAGKVAPSTGNCIESFTMWSLILGTISIGIGTVIL